ncbi:XdhC family protein [Pantoea rwandensis]|uniref:XshC-Cox1 family protein n=1 Tax=Pantoea rwandensis TaxID=1076550 RepID=A0A1X1CX30_9GAMM|nr:XdhC family protein [Pantoea rwandensis]ORM68881.1 XshC-Cox1 family protein [Pantoea rwandensis]
MHHLDVQVLNATLAWVEEQPVWLCTVLSTFGSSPRPPGAMMVIRGDGRYCGSLSGGCVEESFIARIGEDLFSSSSQIVRYGDGGFEPDRALPCGGVLDILVEKLVPGKETCDYLRQMMSALTGPHSVVKTLRLPGPCRSLQSGAYLSRTFTQVQGADVVLTLCAPPRVVIAGLSSVALYCANFAQALGFETLVCEHREDVLLNLADELDASVTLIRQFPANYLEREGCHSGTAILSLTHDPRIDDLTMMEAVNLPAFYIGAMGSQNNSRRRKERLVRIGELHPEQIKRIHAPIGMDIGSKTPAEIALSIMADIVRHKNGLVDAQQQREGVA